MALSDLAFILIAPNLSQQSAGEPIKALHIFREILRRYPDTIQITHARFRHELQHYPECSSIRFIEDDWIFRLCWKSRVLRHHIDARFSKLATRQIAQLIDEQRWSRRRVIVWHTLPNSPPQWRTIRPNVFNVIGPVNGNIYWPPVFRHLEPPRVRLRRLLHMPVQRINRFLGTGCSGANLILVAGGERTTASLLTGGCDPSTLFPSVDYGLSTELLRRPRITHSGHNSRFVHFGRLVFHKGTDLAIEAIARTKTRASLDVIGRGDELARLRTLVTQLNVADRVVFRDWFQDRSELFDSLSQYRGMVLPSFEDANGIVVQEAMAVGLPPICLDWGGPQLLVNNDVDGLLVRADTRDAIINGLAHAMDNLADDGARAEAISIAARDAAHRWTWHTVIGDWLEEIDLRCSRATAG